MAVTKDQDAYWRAQMAKGVPDISDAAALRFKAVRACAVITSSNGVGIRMMTDEGDMAEVFLNPVVAQRLIRQIYAAGETGEWLDENAQVNVAP